MAASLGLVGHEAYYAAAYAPPAASSCFFPDDLVAGSGAVMEFPPAAAVADYYFPEIMGARAPEYYCSPPAPAFANSGGAAAAESGMAMSNMSYVDDDGWRMMMVSGGSAGSGGGRRAPPRIGFRTRSEVDVLDDGFKWRKYGKKAVKSSPNPRNYYRCSAEGCGVKKRVERDRDDPRYVVTSYDGVHNHAAPGAAAAAACLATPRGAAQCVPRPATACSAAPWSAPGVGAPCDAWETQQLHAAAAAAHSSESSY